MPQKLKKAAPPEFSLASGIGCNSNQDKSADRIPPTKCTDII